MKLKDYKGEYVLVSKEDDSDEFDLVEADYLINFLYEMFEDLEDAKNATIYCAVKKVIDDIDITDTVTEFIEYEVGNNEVSDNLYFDNKEFKNIMGELNSWIKKAVGDYYTVGENSEVIELSDCDWDLLTRLKYSK